VNQQARSFQRRRKHGKVLAVQIAGLLGEALMHLERFFDQMFAFVQSLAPEATARSLATVDRFDRRIG